jgi:hypothetical protein
MNKLKFLACLGSFFLTNYHSAQTITGISASGAIVNSSGSNYSITWTSTAGANAQYKEITLSLTGFGGNDEIWFADTSSQSTWELQYGSVGSNAWKEFCPGNSGPGKPMPFKPGNNTTAKVYIRNSLNSKGTYSNLITFGVGSGCGSFTTSITIQATVNIVDANTGIYTWSEPTSGSDSSYKIAGNWTPTRTSPKSTDVLVVDLASTTTTRNTTIYMDGVSDSISQFIIYPYNHVTFKCSTSTNTGNWYIGPKTTPLSDFEFRLDTLAGMTVSGGTLNLHIIGSNEAIFRSNLTIYSGSLNFTGNGNLRFRKDIRTYGGNLWFKPNTNQLSLFLQGRNTKLTGTAGNLYLDSNILVFIGNGSVSDYTLERSLPLYSKLTIRENTRLISNSPNSNSSSDWNAWTPHLQFKWFDKVGSKAFGELAILPSSSSIQGGALLEYLNSTRRAYRTVGIPLKNGTNLSQFTDDIHLTGTVTDPANKDSFTTSCSWCKSSIFRWNEATASWSPYTSGTTANKIDNGKGVLVFFRGARDLDHGLGDTSILANKQIIDFKGQIQTGSVTISGLSKLNGSGLSGANLIANPYPSTLNFRSVADGNASSIMPRYYTYDALAKNYNTWDSSVNGTPQKGGASWFQNAGGDARYINPGAAFFVFAKSNNVSITITEAMKEATKRSKGKNFEVQELTETPCNEFKMTINYTNDTAFESDGFTLQYDLNNSEISNNGDMYDAPKFYGGHLGLGTLTNNNTWLAIDRRNKLAESNSTHTVAIKVAYPKTGPTDVFLTTNTCSQGNGPYKIQLVDKVLNKVVEIGDKSTYFYSINNSEEKREDRFEILFSAVEVQLGVLHKASNPKYFILYPNPATDGQFNVVNNKLNRVKQIEIYNAQGQLIKTISNCTTDLISINLNASSGIYTAVITGEKNSETHRIAIP